MPSESFFDCSVDVGRFRGSRGLSKITFQGTHPKGCTETIKGKFPSDPPRSS